MMSLHALAILVNFKFAKVFTIDPLESVRTSAYSTILISARPAYRKSLWFTIANVSRNIFYNCTYYITRYDVGPL